MIYLTSDLHFGHENVIRFQNRPWPTVEAMNDGLVNNINETVGVNDELYVLGDFSFRIKQAEAWELRKRILCRNVHLVRGNHDCGWSGTNAFKTVSDYAELKTGVGKVILSHYPFLTWNAMHHGSLHLHGHIHSDGSCNLENAEAGIRRYDVGVDANGYRPVSLDDILAFFGLQEGKPCCRERF